MVSAMGNSGARCKPAFGIVHPVRASPSGPTRNQLRGKSWRKVTHGLYVPVSADRTRVEQRIAEEAGRLGGSGAVTGWAALRLYRGRYFDGLEPDGRTEIPVPLALGPTYNLTTSPAIHLFRERLDAADVTHACGVPATVECRAAFDEMRRSGDLREAVVAMDMAAAAEIASIRQVREYAAAHPGFRRSALVRGALDLAIENSRSPMESRMRLVWVLDAGFPPPLCNRAIFDRAGRHLGTPDLLDVDAGVVGEYDGAEHRNRARHREDVSREEAFRRAGLSYFEIVAGDGPEVMVDRMTWARENALWLPASRRRWTIKDPLVSAEEPMSLEERIAFRQAMEADREWS